MPVVGTAPVKPCPQCQFRNNTHSTFCQNCGQALAMPQAVPSTQPVAKPIARSAVNQPSIQPVAKPVARSAVNQPLVKPATRPLTPPAPYQPSTIASPTQSIHQKLLFQLQMFAYGLIGLGGLILGCLIFGPFVQASMNGDIGSLLSSSFSGSASAIHFALLLLGALFEPDLANEKILIFFALLIILLLPAYAIFVMMTGSKLSKALVLNQLAYSIKHLQIISGIMLGFFGVIYATLNLSINASSNVLGAGGGAKLGLGWGFTVSLIALLAIFISCIWYKNTVLKLSVTP
ncbi:hypothetical protein [Herpetosiphon llansteffanensis]|uniref:hypothetical protein n=1 Tax=Herpetosiphon llansteffanensis TaxID=2094568 RepID=UPI000D7D08A7|nr:hypothetical protein [Herpetosiphon llansteffanensis]